MKKIPFERRKKNKGEIFIIKSNRLDSCITEFYREPCKYHFKFIKKAAEKI